MIWLTGPHFQEVYNLYQISQNQFQYNNDFAILFYEIFHSELII